MRTTLDIDDDVLQAARQRARAEKISVGKALSLLARESLPGEDATTHRNGLPLLPGASRRVTAELVAELLDESA